MLWLVGKQGYTWGKKEETPGKVWGMGRDKTGTRERKKLRQDLGP